MRSEARIRHADASDGRAALDELARRVAPVTLARDHQLPVATALEPLLPEGLRRGAVHAVRGSTSLALALVAAASAATSWVAAVGWPSLGLAAASELGIALERLVLVAAPRREAWGTVAAALVDGFDIVVVRPDRGLRAADARRLTARARERGTVIVVAGDVPGDAPDVALTVVEASWYGVGEGHGHLQARRMTVEATGRRGAARPRRADLWLPAPGGGVDAVAADPVPLTSRREARDTREVS